LFSIFQPDLVITPDSKKMDEEDNVPDKPQTIGKNERILLSSPVNS
jgi:hypothetical protein